MEKIYNPHQLEQQIYQQWEKNDYFKASGHGKPYCIVIPPPNITGSLHMGHGFQYVMMDALIRYHRMLGNKVWWQMGTDHAGIATQMVVENQLAMAGKKRHEIGRKAFIECIWQWQKQYGGNISQQMRRLGVSLDWSKARFTMDDHFNSAVRNVFVRLYQEGLIYRKKRLVNWDPHFKTAISDLEVNAIEEQGQLWYIRYPLSASKAYVVVATTRPETMLGDVAIAVHPDDQRYHKFVGQLVKLPLTTRMIPIIADSYVDPTFGSGCVKITPAHDFNDYDIAKRHHLPLINIFTKSATINDNALPRYRGLERFAARRQIIADLKDLQLLEKVVPHQLSVPRNDRGNHIIEPYLTDQWYVKVAPLAKAAIAVVKAGQTQFVPENWANTYFQWLENIEDWCISRQLWWGHRIPAWYDQKGEVYVGNSEEEVCQHYHLENNVKLTPDPDVLDTWFSSSLWPFVTLGWPQKNKTFTTFYPTTVLVTGFDIIFFWVVRMMMMALHFTGKVPFETVYITGLIRDQKGQKMSKTKGNVIDPIDLIDGIDLASLITKRCKNLMQHSQKEAVVLTTQKQFPKGIKACGADALRFTYLALASQGRDIRFDSNRLTGYHNFCNKLWHAARYVINHAKDSVLPVVDFKTATTIDQWILSTLQHTIAAAHCHFNNYRFDLLAQLLHDFTWHHYCDWYLEFTKSILACKNIKKQQRLYTLATLVYVLENTLRLLHPLIPFITEAIWQKLSPMIGKANNTIMLQAYPKQNIDFIKQSAQLDVEWLKQIITTIRNSRSEMTISPATRLKVLLNQGNALDKARIKQYGFLIESLAKLSTLQWLKAAAPNGAISIFSNELEIIIPLSATVDCCKQRQRLQKAITNAKKRCQALDSKLQNSHFMAKAPAHVIADTKQQYQEMTTTLAKLAQRLTAIETH